MKNQKFSLWITLAALLSMGIFLLSAYLQYGFGYPLDDAWIHQTYARNLAKLGEWSFIPGIPSSGNTSPLWSVLLSFGYFISDTNYFWTFILGWISLSLTGIFGEKIFQSLFPDVNLNLPLAGLFLVFEWHIVWAAISGMETILLMAFVVMVYWVILRSKNWEILGLLIGAGVWIRPDAITLLGPALLVAWLYSTSWKNKILLCCRIAGSFLILFLPYLIFNQFISNSLWPNTFYAKQAEYSVLLETPLFLRIIKLASLPLIGAGILLLPGIFFFIRNALENRNWTGLCMLVWWSGYTLIYALRLPVTYQHGRYLMPAMPVLFLSGIAGYHSYIKKRKALSRIRFVFQTSWSLGIVIVLIAFFALGANSFAKDVGIIQTEMVQTAQWANENLPENAVIAAHDIGALGFYGNRYLIDLAGLISPDVIPFIRDENKLAIYLADKKADYLITFPNWYPYLSTLGKKVYSSDGKISPLMGGENMAIFMLRQ